jgi:hypothetical protein
MAIIDYLAACGDCELGSLVIECRNQALDFSTIYDVVIAVNEMISLGQMFEYDSVYGLTDVWFDANGNFMPPENENYHI